jgi:tight adherence protein C
MPVTVLVGIAALSLAGPLLLWTTVLARSAHPTRIRSNLTRGLVADLPAERQGSMLAALIRRLVPHRNVVSLRRRYALAGQPPSWSIPRLLLVKPLLAAGIVLFGFGLLDAAGTPVLAVGTVAVAAVGYFVPDLLLQSRGTERSAAIALELPDTLDQMLIAVEAGLGFEAAMARAGQNGKGPLAQELVRTLQDMRVGMSRKDAYTALGERTAVPELRAFIRAIVQADAYGISVSAVLRVQAKEMRVKRRQRAEEAAMKIPVKVIFPLMLFILPVLMLVVLGPTITHVIASF